MLRLNQAVSLSFLAVLALVLAGCGDGKKTELLVKTGASGKTGDAGAAKAGDGSLERVKKAEVLKWGADPSGGAPFVYFDDKDTSKIIGFEMDIMEKLATHAGYKSEMSKGDWDNLPDLLLAKRVDVIVNGYEITEERKNAVSFSEPYYVYEQQLTVRAEDKDKYKSLDDLKGKKVGTLKNAEANNVLKEAGWIKDLIMEHPDSQSPYEDLILKRTDAVLQESIIAEFYAGKDQKLYNIPKTFSSGQYGVMVRLEDKALLDNVNRILRVMKENGELAAIYKKWGIWTERQKEIGIKEGAK